MSVQRRKYDSDFRRNAVQLTEESGRGVKALADNLGINKDLLYRWIREQLAKTEGAFPGRAREAFTDPKKESLSWKRN